jgi:hypothetical protein
MEQDSSPRQGEAQNDGVRSIFSGEGCVKDGVCGCYQCYADTEGLSGCEVKKMQSAFSGIFKHPHSERGRRKLGKWRILPRIRQEIFVSNKGGLEILRRCAPAKKLW